MARTIYVSMLPYNWRKSFDMFNIKIMRLLKLCTEGVATPIDTNPLRIVMASEYMFRKNPMGAVKDVQQSTFLRNDTSPTKTSNPVNFYDQSYKHTIHTTKEKDELIQKLSMATKGKNIMVVAGSIMWAEKEPVMGLSKKQDVKAKGEALNSTYIIHNGSMVYEYNKKTDVGEIDIFEKSLFDFTAGSDGGTFVADGLTFGIEICGDHGKLRTSLESESTPASIDIHLLISDGMTFNAPVMRKDGFGLHCDRSKGEVWKNTAPVRTRVPATGELNWTLTLN